MNPSGPGGFFFRNFHLQAQFPNCLVLGEVSRCGWEAGPFCPRCHRDRERRSHLSPGFPHHPPRRHPHFQHRCCPFVSPLFLVSGLSMVLIFPNPETVGDFASFIFLCVSVPDLLISTFIFIIPFLLFALPSSFLGSFRGALRGLT